MREIVHMQAGQCGNQIGAKVRALERTLKARWPMIGLEARSRWDARLAIKIWSYLLCTDGVSYAVGVGTAPPTFRLAPPTLCSGSATPGWSDFNLSYLQSGVFRPQRHPLGYFYLSLGFEDRLGKFVFSVFITACGLWVAFCSKFFFKARASSRRYLCGAHDFHQLKLM